MARWAGGSQAVTTSRSVTEGIPNTFVRTTSRVPSPRSGPATRIHATSGIHDAWRSQSTRTDHVRSGVASNRAVSSRRTGVLLDSRRGLPESTPGGSGRQRPGATPERDRPEGRGDTCPDGSCSGSRCTSCW